MTGPSGDTNPDESMAQRRRDRAAEHQARFDKAFKERHQPMLAARDVHRAAKGYPELREELDGWLARYIDVGDAKHLAREFKTAALSLSLKQRRIALDMVRREEDLQAQMRRRILQRAAELDTLDRAGGFHSAQLLELGQLGALQGDTHLNRAWLEIWNADMRACGRIVGKRKMDRASRGRRKSTLAIVTFAWIVAILVAALDIAFLEVGPFAAVLLIAAPSVVWRRHRIKNSLAQHALDLLSRLRRSQEETLEVIRSGPSVRTPGLRIRRPTGERLFEEALGEFRRFG